MTEFIQLHLLTAYPPANLNRDDLGRPKTAVVGGTNRLRISSQSLKRAWRKSELFEAALANHIGTRTKFIGTNAYKLLKEKNVAETKAKEWAKLIAGTFGKLKEKAKDTIKKKDLEASLFSEEVMPEVTKKKDLEDLEIEQLVHISPAEQLAINELVELLATRNTAPTDNELELLKKQHTATDIAMFGRMLASKPAYNVEAAVQVAHAFSVQQVTVEDDFFTAVDDLNTHEEDSGSSHLGESEFGSGLFYLYICIDKDNLLKNLDNDAELTSKTLRALIEAAAKVAPNGKQNSYASRARASYILAEKGTEQPRSLAVAFLKAIKGEDILARAIQALQQTSENMDKVYGACAAATYNMNAYEGKGSLNELLDFVVGG